MSIKPSIHKTKFKKLLKAMRKNSNLYYKQGDFIASETIHISLNGLENLDDLKPAIVEIFGHLEGEWILSHRDKQVYDYHGADAALHFKCLLDSDYDYKDDFMKLRETGFEYGGKVVFDNLTIIPNDLMIHDYVTFFKPIDTMRIEDPRTIVVTDSRDDDDVIPFMIIKNTLKLTGNDIVPAFYDALTESYNTDEESEIVDDAEEGDE